MRDRTERQAKAERPSILELLAYFDKNRLNIEAGQRWTIAQLKGKRPTDATYVTSLPSRDRELWELTADYGLGGIHLMISRHDAPFWIRWLVPWVRATQILAGRSQLQPFAMSKLSLALRWLQRHSCARAILISAEKLVDGAPDSVDLGIRGEVLAGLSSVYLALDEPKKALRYAKATRVLKKDLSRERPEQRKNEPGSAGSIGLALHRLRGAKSALPYYEEQRKLAHDIGNLQAERAAHSYLGSAYMDLERYQEASRSFERALELARILGQAWQEKDLLACMAAAAQKLGDDARALTLLNNATGSSDGNRTRSRDELLKELQDFSAARGWKITWGASSSWPN